jgi:SAM-dependent methyltransferase
MADEEEDTLGRIAAVSRRAVRPRAQADAAPPSWRRLWRHSYRLGARWLLTGRRHRWRGARVGICRLLVPLDPWRFWELGRIAGEDFRGRNLDVSSPKLLPSLLRAEGRGEWVAVDLFADEVESWRAVDPELDLRVEDARSLSFADGAFDGCVCVSVIEHIAGDGDATAMAEIWRVLRPGGVLHLTVPVAQPHRDVMIDRQVYGEASARVGDQVFFARYYGEAELDRRLLGLPWEVLAREYVRQADTRIESRFHALAPWSYPLGFTLRWLCPGNFRAMAGPGELGPDEHGVVYLKLRKPA